MPIEKLLDPKNDFAFKKIFGSKQHENILIHFLNDMLDLNNNSQIKNVTFLKPIQDPEIASKKESIVDVLCEDYQGTKYIVEMQVTPFKGFEKRAQYYAAKAYSRQMNVGDSYHALKEVIFLAISNYVMFPNKKGYYSTHVVLDTQEYTRDLRDFSFSFLELPKFTKRFNELENKIDRWAYFFKNASSITPEKLASLTNKHSIFKDAYSALERAHWTEEELNRYEESLKKTLDYLAVQEYCIELGEKRGEKKGKEKGIKIGEERSKKLIAIKLLSTGMELEQVAAIVGLTTTELQQCLSE